MNIGNIIDIYGKRTVHETNKNAKPLASVVIPFFRAGFAGWIPFESLIRQEGVNYEWELIILEELIDNPFKLRRILQYEERLKDKGCVNIKYISLPYWIPLASKWYFLFQEMASTSKVALCNSHDIYMSRYRLKRQMEAIEEGYNWHKISGNIVYDIGSDTHVKLTSMHKDRPDTCCAAIAKNLTDKLPISNRKKGVDGWRYGSLRNYVNFYYDTSSIWNDTVNVNGMNNISRTRHNRVIKCVPPLQKCCTDIEHHLPKEVVKMLRGLRDKIEKHNQLIDKSIAPV